MDSKKLEAASCECYATATNLLKAVTLCLLKTPSRSSEAMIEGKSTHFVVRCATTIACQTAQ